MLCTCEIPVISIRQLRLSSHPGAELRTQWSPGENTAWNPAAFISYFYYLFGFQFRAILPSSSQQISQVHTVIRGPTQPVMQWMEIGIQTSATVHTLTKKTILGGE